MNRITLAALFSSILLSLALLTQACAPESTDAATTTTAAPLVHTGSSCAALKVACDADAGEADGGPSPCPPCSGALAGGGYRGDELCAASQPIYAALEACACGTPHAGESPATLGHCSSVCSSTDESNDWICGVSWPVDGVDWTQSQADACEACVEEIDP